MLITIYFFSGINELMDKNLFNIKLKYFKLSAEMERTQRSIDSVKP